jgi:hypothetical protein
MMPNLLQSVAIAVWCLIALLLFVGIREIIKLEPRTKARPRSAPEEKAHVFEKYVSAHTHVAVRYGHYFAKTTRLRHVEPRPFVKGARAEHRRSASAYITAKKEVDTHTRVRMNNSMKKHDEEYPIAVEA